MKRGAIVLLAWGAWLGVMTAAMLPFTGVHPASYGVHPIEYWMFGGASGACLSAGLLLWLIDARRRARTAADAADAADAAAAAGAGAAAGEPARLLADESLAVTTLVAGLALALLGAGFGFWLVLIGAGVIALGVGGLVRERRARRRTVLRVRAQAARQRARREQTAAGGSALPARTREAP